MKTKNFVWHLLKKDRWKKVATSARLIAHDGARKIVIQKFSRTAQKGK